MTKFLVSEQNPKGYKLEDILRVIRKDIVLRCDLIIDDTRPEAEQVISNNMEILNLVTKAIHLALNSTDVLNTSFGPSGNKPRMGRRAIANASAGNRPSVIQKYANAPA